MWKRDEQESQFSEMIEAQLSRRHFFGGQCGSECRRVFSLKSGCECGGCASHIKPTEFLSNPCVNRR